MDPVSPATPLSSHSASLTVPLSLPSLQTVDVFINAPEEHGMPAVVPILKISSLEHRRPIADVFSILDWIMINSSYWLQCGNPNTGKPDLHSEVIRKTSPGCIKSGFYIICDTIPIDCRPLRTFATRNKLFEDMTFKCCVCGSPQKLHPCTQNQSNQLKNEWQDDTSDPSGFKNRLICRDRGCVVCLALGKSGYGYPDDSQHYNGGHIIPFAYEHLWKGMGFSSMVTDPFTDPKNGDTQTTSRSNDDPGRINSVDNGMLFCLEHHKSYNTFRFSIHPESHRIYTFHPAAAELHGVEVTVPWLSQDRRLPPPHPLILKAHYMSCIAFWMEIGAGPCTAADEDDELEENDELEEMKGSEDVNVYIHVG